MRCEILQKTCLAVALVASCSTAVRAQQFVRPPDAGQILKEVTPEPQVPPKPNQLLLPPITPSRAGKVPSASGISFVLNSVRFKGNTVYSPDKLRPLVSQYIGKKIGMAELQAMANAITDYYQ